MGLLDNIGWSVHSGENVMFNSGITLNGGEEIFVYAHYNYTSAGWYNVTATVDYNNTILESSEANNQESMGLVVS